MAVFTTVLYVISFLTAVYSLWIRNPLWAIAALAAILVIDSIINGFQWQVVPLVFTVVLLSLLVVWSDAPRWGYGLAITLLVVSFSISSLLRHVFQDFEFPRPTGDYAVGVTDHVWKSGVNAKIWYPSEPGVDDELYGYIADYDRPVFNMPPFVYSHLKNLETYAYADSPAASGTFPVILYAYSADGNVEENTFLVTDLASHGFVVIAVDHEKGLADYDLDLMALSSKPPQFLAAMTDVIMVDRKKEFAQVAEGLNELNSTNDFLKNTLDLTTVNFMGFSLGGAIVTDYCSTGVVCGPVVNLDGNPFAVAHESGLTSPYLHMSQDFPEPNIGKVEAGSMAAIVDEMTRLYKRDVQKVVSKTTENGHQATWLTLTNSGHGVFSDFQLWIAVRWGMLAQVLGTADPITSYETIRDLTVNFFKDPASIRSAINKRQTIVTPFSD